MKKLLKDLGKNIKNEWNEAKSSFKEVNDNAKNSVNQFFSNFPNTFKKLIGKRIKPINENNQQILNNPSLLNDENINCNQIIQINSNNPSNYINNNNNQNFNNNINFNSQNIYNNNYYNNNKNINYDFNSNSNQNINNNFIYSNQSINNNYNYNINNNINNNSFNLNNEEKPVNYIEPDKLHLRGLVNIANTCYMNSILQCFINIKELAVYFQTEKMENLVLNNKNDNKKLFPAFQEVVKQLWDPWDKSAYSPYNFKNRLGQMNPLFQGAMPNDAKDLLTFILLQLHEELNKPKINNNNDDMNYMNIQNDHKTMFTLFCKYFANNYRSIVSGLFYGIFYSINQCNNGHTFYNYQTFNFIIFPLEKVLQYKNISNNFMSNFNNTVTLEDCFNYYEYPTILNDYYCNICKCQCSCNYINKLSVLPNIIIIILNRGKGLEHKVNISFQNENLGLSKFVEYSSSIEDSTYELIGLVTHYGDSSVSGHFMARCKSPIDDEWYLYNDSIVQKIGYFNNETFAQGNPYILFYKKINFQK